MFTLAPAPRPQPTMLLSMAVPGRGAVVACSFRKREVVGSNPTALTRDAVMGSESPKAVVGVFAITTGTNGTDRRANKRGEAHTDN